MLNDRGRINVGVGALACIQKMKWHVVCGTVSMSMLKYTRRQEGTRHEKRWIKHYYNDIKPLTTAHSVVLWTMTAHVLQYTAREKKKGYVEPCAYMIAVLTGIDIGV